MCKSVGHTIQKLKKRHKKVLKHHNNVYMNPTLLIESQGSIDGACANVWQQMSVPKKAQGEMHSDRRRIIQQRDFPLQAALVECRMGEVGEHADGKDARKRRQAHHGKPVTETFFSRKSKCLYVFLLLRVCVFLHALGQWKSKCLCLFLWLRVCVFLHALGQCLCRASKLTLKLGPLHTLCTRCSGLLLVLRQDMSRFPYILLAHD